MMTSQGMAENWFTSVYFFTNVFLGEIFFYPLNFWTEGITHKNTLLRDLLRHCYVTHNCNSILFFQIYVTDSLYEKIKPTRCYKKTISPVIKYNRKKNWRKHFICIFLQWLSLLAQKNGHLVKFWQALFWPSCYSTYLNLLKIRNSCSFVQITKKITCWINKKSFLLVLLYHNLI